jgi:hypothetical protein
MAGRELTLSGGLKIDWENPEATISKLAWLTQTPKEFDFESCIGRPNCAIRDRSMTAVAE